MLRFLEFESTDADASVVTWEAMASIRPADRPALAQELWMLMDRLPQWLGAAPSPLDEGGSWDVWIQAQWEGHPPITLEAQPGGSGWAVWTETPKGPWLALSVTLSAEGSIASELAGRVSAPD